MSSRWVAMARDEIQTVGMKCGFEAIHLVRWWSVATKKSRIMAGDGS
jgi:hypothetical protein